MVFRCDCCISQPLLCKNACVLWIFVVFCLITFVMKRSWLGDLSLRAAVHIGFWQNGFDHPCFTKHQHLDDSNSPSNTPTKPIYAELDMICSLCKGGIQDLSSVQNYFFDLHLSYWLKYQALQTTKLFLLSPGTQHLMTELHHQFCGIRVSSS